MKTPRSRVVALPTEVELEKKIEWELERYQSQHLHVMQPDAVPKSTTSSNIKMTSSGE